jgi:spoIIIJ-associated protein
MDGFMEFQGKTIDEAIAAACSHFDTDREKLELEILTDAKGGIFGLVGAKKAVVKARARENTAELHKVVATVVERLLTPIIGPPKLEVDVEESGRAKVLIQDDKHSGLLIGREGQTLAALQYLTNRIVAKRWKTPVRVQIDTGQYRERQDEELRELAQRLADKAKAQGRPQSTKPLSSYHRRVIHVALQEDATIQTRSKGDGPMKRVVIMPRRNKAADKPELKAEPTEASSDAPKEVEEQE